MIDFVKTLTVFVKDHQKGYIRCKRCGAKWRVSTFYKLSGEEQEKIRNGKGCRACRNEIWEEGKYIGDKK